ncbi:MAG: hypothetical protein ACM3PF_04280 [Bacteroidota bacterium]
MSARAKWPLIAMLALVPVSAGAQATPGPGEPLASPPAGAPTDTTRVTYLAGPSVYLQAGRDRGLAEGDTVVVAGAAAMRLRVTAVSSSRAVCEPLPGSAAGGLPRVGDLVRFRPGAPPAGGATSGGSPAAAAADTSGSPTRAAAAPTARAASFRRPIRGRAGIGYLKVDGPGTGYSRPTADLRLEGRSSWGAPVDFVVDVRGHRLERAGGPTETAARVYRLSVSSAADDGSRRFTAGRQSIAIASAPGQFDGVSFEYGSPSWTAGLFSGFEPLRYGYDFDPGILWTGVYAGARGSSPARQWGLTLGGMDAHDHGVPSRAAVFAQATYHDSRLSLFGAQAADLNSAWKQARGEPAISSTSTLVTANARLWTGVTLMGGYDGRRNVLLARDRETPETAFDDQFRQGGWGGLSIEPGWASRLDGTARWTSGGFAGTAWAWTGSVERHSIPPLDGRLSLRSSRVESNVERGWLHAASFSVRAGGASEIALSGGFQRTRDPFLGTLTKSAWQGLDADLGVGGRWYLQLQGQRETGDEGKATTGYAGFSWRF